MGLRDAGKVRNQKQRRKREKGLGNNYGKALIPKTLGRGGERESEREIRRERR